MSNHYGGNTFYSDCFNAGFFSLGHMLGMYVLVVARTSRTGSEDGQFLARQAIFNWRITKIKHMTNMVEKHQPPESCVFNRLARKHDGWGRGPNARKILSFPTASRSEVSKLNRIRALLPSLGPASPQAGCAVPLP